MRFLILFTVLCSSLLQAKSYELEANLDPLFKLPEAYKVKPQDLETLFDKGGFKQNPYFQWLNTDKTRAIFKRKPASNIEVNFTLFEGAVAVDELIIDFKKGKYRGVTFSVFNRGDSSEISQKEFQHRTETIKSYLTEILATNPRAKVGNLKKGKLTSGYAWRSKRGLAVLEYNPEAPEKTEFIRLRLGHPKARGVYLSGLKEKVISQVKRSELQDFVTTTNDGDTFISGIPMVDQGAKGYCVVASVQRVFEHFGIPCDMHQLAQLAKADPERGTSSLYINNQLGAIDHLFKTRYSCLAIAAQSGGLYTLKEGKYLDKPVPDKAFLNIIKRNIDNGIPLLWSLDLGLYPEEPAISEQANGGHMRLIIGYNEKSQRILFSDSWGAGHEKKSMQMPDAYRATKGLFLMKPTIN